jgi:glycosyltransferase involved in cell wall biosynthesis
MLGDIVDKYFIGVERLDSMVANKQQIRVGVFTYGMNDSLTGIGRYTQELTYALREQYSDLEIVLISPYPESPLPWYGDFETFTVPQLKRLPMVIARGSAILSAASKTLALDIFHDPCGIAPFGGGWPKATRKVVTIHDAIPLNHPEYQPFLTRWVFRTSLPKARYTADAICTDSQNARDDILQLMHYPPDQVFVTYPGVRSPTADQILQWQQKVETVRFRLALPSRYFLFVSAVSPRKNVKRLMEAFSIVYQQDPDIALVLAGPMNKEISAMLETPGRAPGVLGLGYVDEEILHPLYVGATAVVYPSLYEGFGLPALEAMAHGTPIITSNTSSLPEVVGSAGWLVDPTDVDAISQAMVEVLNHPNARQLHYEAAQVQVKKFSWEQTARATRQVYDHVLAKSL